MVSDFKKDKWGGNGNGYFREYLYSNDDFGESLRKQLNGFEYKKKRKSF